MKSGVGLGVIGAAGNTQPLAPGSGFVAWG
jgi:hypothetical protein